MSMCMNCRYWRQLPRVEDYEQGKGECHMPGERVTKRLGYRYPCKGFESRPAEGPTAVEHEADSTAWELSRRNCPCRDCKGRGNLPCDECGVTP